MAEKADLGATMAQHGDKIIIALCAVCVLFFLFTMLTSGKTEYSPEAFKKAAEDLEETLNKGEVPPAKPRNESVQLGKDTGPNNDIVRSALDPAGTKPMVGFDLAIESAGPIDGPPSQFAVVSARFGKVALKFRPTKNKNCQSYLLKWWEKGKAEPSDETRENTKDLRNQEREGGQMEVVIERLTDNTTYIFKLRSLDRGGKPVDYVGATPDKEGPDGKGLFLEVTPSGKEKGIPNPANAIVNEASLAGVKLSWGDPAKLFPEEKPGQDTGTGMVKPEFTRILIWRWTNDPEKKTLMNKEDDVHPTGWKLGDFPKNEMWDYDLVPEMEIHYGIQFVQIEAFPTSAGTVDIAGKEVKELSYRSPQRVKFRLVEYDENTGAPKFNGKKKVMVNGKEVEVDAVESWVEREAYASEVVEFERAAGPIKLPNRPVLICVGIRGEERVPQFEQNTVDLMVTKYFQVKDPAATGNVMVWQRFTARFTTKVNEKVGGKMKPTLAGDAKIDRNSKWNRIEDLDFSTPYMVMGVYTINFSSKNNHSYAELQNTERPDTWPFKVYRDKDVKDKPYLAGLPASISEGLTKPERLALYRKYLAEVEYPAEAAATGDKGNYMASDKAMLQKKEDFMYAMDAKTGAGPMWDFSTKYQIRFYPPKMRADVDVLERIPMNQIRQLAEESRRELKNQVQQMIAQINPNVDDIPKEFKEFAMLPGSDDAVIPALVVTLRTPKADAGPAVWKLIVEILAQRKRTLPPALQSAANPDAVTANLPKLEAELKKYYDIR